MIRLLDPNSRLRSVKIEGVAPTDFGTGNDADFLAVDVTEYFGGIDFAAADETVVSQLKYSTRHPGRQWTVARLCAKGTSGRSLLGALADAYTAFRRQSPGRNLAGRLRIQLVSNQPLAPRAATFLDRVQRTLSDERSASIESLRRELDDASRRDLDRCLGVVNITPTEREDFFRCLDFAGCGVAALEFQQLRLAAELMTSFPGRAHEAADRLVSVVRKAALPAAVNDPGIGLHELLANFPVTSVDRLFPCPSLLATPAQPVATEDGERLAQKVVATAGQPLLVHGEAGTGKSTTLNSLAGFLPAGSVVLTYDCFGRGEYLDFSRARHVESRVWLQLSNELAVHCGSAFLVEPPQERHDLRRDFEQRLIAAASIVDVSGGLLVLAVDAADNAAIAGRMDQESAFIAALWSLRVPDGARLIVSARSERREMLNAPDGLAEFQLLGFHEPASAAHLRQFHPSATEAECAEFHRKTNGNPRVQAYLFAIPRSLAEVLRLAERTPEGIFQELLDDATRHWTHPDRARSHLATLVALARPVPLTVFADACGVTLAEVESFCGALKPGLLIDGGTVAFRDEPFETFLREQFTQEELRVTDAALATYLLGRATTDPYAARAVSEHLYRSYDGARLVQLAIVGPEPTAILDEVDRLAVLWRRITLALKWARGVEFAKLLLLAADAARAHGALGALVKARPDLAALFANREELEKLYLDGDEEAWLAPAFWRLGAVYSRHPTLRDAAIEAMRHGEGWIRRWLKRDDSERERWHLRPTDVANECLAVYSLSGPERAIDSWMRWRPRRFRAEVLQRLVPAVAGRLRAKDWPTIAALRLPIRVWAVLLGATAAAGNPPPVRLVRMAIAGLHRAARKGRRIRLSSFSYIVSLCELAAQLGISRRRILLVLKHHGPYPPQRTPTGPHDTASWNDPIRAALLRAALTGKNVNLPDLLRWPIKKPADRNKLDAERKRLVESLASFFNAHKIRTDALLGKSQWKQWNAQCFAELAMWEGKTGQRWFKGEWPFIQWAEVVCDVGLLSTREFTPLFERIVDLAPKVVPGSELSFWPDLAAKLLRQKRYHVIGWRLLERAADNALSRPMPGGQRWETLLNCSAIASEHDMEQGRQFYERSVEAAVATQDEAINQLGFHDRVAISVASSIPGEQRAALAARLGSTTERHESLVSESGSIPWGFTLGAMTTLDLATGLAWVGRWDDEGSCDLAASMGEVVAAAVKSRHIIPRDGLALLRFLHDHQDLDSFFVELLDAQRERGSSGRADLVDMLATISFWIRRDVLLRRRDSAAKSILSWAEKHGHAHVTGMQELRKLREFVRGLPEAVGIFRGSYEPTRTEQPPKVRRSRGPIRKRLTAAWAANEDAEISACIKEAAANTGEPQRRAFLDFLTGLGFEPFYLAARIGALTECLRAWPRIGAVKSWSREALPAFLDGVMPAVLHYEHASLPVRQSLVRLIEATGVAVEDALRMALQGHVQLLSSRQALAFAETVLARLNANEQYQTLDWSLGRMEKRLEAESLPPRSPANAPSSQGPAEVLACFLWAQTGHPNRPTRWRALHATRAIARRDEALLAALVTCSRRNNDGGFRSPGLEFFWMSARCSLFLLFRHFAAADPALLRRHMAALSEIATDSAFPHVLVRELARNSVLAVVDRFPEMGADKREQIELLNRPHACYRERGHSRDSGHDEKPEKRERRFTFDLMDTIPYWFTPAAGVFGISVNEFIRRAELWICDRWGQTKDDWWNDPRELEHRGHWSRGSHRHGQIPEYEVQRLYLEFHAMCSVMGELVDTAPILCNTYEDAPGPFTQWLGYMLSGSDEAPQWVADLREPTPLDPRYWGVFPALEDWRRERPSTDYDAALESIGDTDFMVINSDVSVNAYDRSESVSVDGFLVSPESALALLRAMQSSESTSDFALPRGDDEHELEYDGFELRGFLQPKGGDVAFQKYDLLRGETRPCRLHLANDFASRLDAVIDAGERQIITRDGRVIVRVEQWSDSEGGEEYSQNSGSTGRRVLIRKDALYQYLGARGLDLLVEVTLSRNAERHYRQEHDEYDLGTTRFYLFRASGQCQTVVEGGTDRAASRKRTRSRKKQRHSREMDGTSSR